MTREGSIVARGHALRKISGMTMHSERERVMDGSIDNRERGKTLITIRFTNHSSSRITLYGNPCRDLAGSLWKFRNPEGKLDEKAGATASILPEVESGLVGHISYARKAEIPILPMERGPDGFLVEPPGDQPTRLVPILEMEWFSEDEGQVEFCYEGLTMELVEMVWSMTAEEAEMEREEVEEARERFDDDFEEEIEPHELEELCFLIVQEFVINSADDSEEKQELHRDLLGLQEQVAVAFVYYTNEGTFEDAPATVKLLGGLLPLIDRAAENARFAAETTAELLLQLREGIVALRDVLAQARDK